MRDTITLAFAGDVMLGRLVNETIGARGFDYPWGNLLPTLRRPDLFFINLECALTTEDEQWRDEHGRHKAFYFRADPTAVETLRLGRVDFASLANNHIGDFGMTGLLDTVHHLERAGIAHAGAGRDLSAARAPARLAAGGWRIAVVAFADYPIDWAATHERPGMSFIPVSLDPDTQAEITDAITQARADADLVVFSIHWGPNMLLRPVPAFKEFARRVVDAGADVFWGHSAHVLQGIEVWNDRLIMYDSGDFVDDYAVDDELRNDLSALFLVRVRPPTVLDVELVPVHIRDMQVTLAEPGERERIIQRVTNLCAEMGTEVRSHPDRSSVVIDRASDIGG